MDARKFKLEEIGTFDSGIVAAVFNAKLRNAILDCDDRPNEKGVRKVMLEFELRPIPDSTGNSCREIIMGFNCKSSEPKLKSREYHLPVAKGKDGRGNHSIDMVYFPEATMDDPEFLDEEASPRRDLRSED